MMHTEPLSMICEATRQTLRIDKFTLILRVAKALNDHLSYTAGIC
jgi:hypothetical protein